jgi:hypothetical protein
MPTFIAGLGLLTGVAVWMVVGTILRGWVISILWKWFIVSAFGVPALGIAAAIGVALLVGTMAHQYTHTEDNRTDGQKAASAVGASILAPLFLLGLGWIIKQFL